MYKSDKINYDEISYIYTISYLCFDLDCFNSNFIFTNTYPYINNSCIVNIMTCCVS